MPQTYSKQRLYDAAQENYLALIKFCDILDTEGYWEQPGAVLQKSIYECLDGYVEAAMIQLALLNQAVWREQGQFIRMISRFHLFLKRGEEELTEEAAEETKRLLRSPPILLQLCGLRDDAKGSGLAGLFLDAVLNILLAFGYLEDAAGGTAAKYITELYQRASVFLYSAARKRNAVDDKYIFYKLSNTDLGKSGRGIQDAGEDFEAYKEEVLGIPNKDRKRTAQLADKEEGFAFRRHRKEEQKSREKEDNPGGAKVESREEDSFRQYISSYEEYEDELEQQAGSDAKETEPPVKTRLDLLLSELNGLVGLAEVKREITSLINLIKVKKLREKHRLPGMDMSFHMVFSGSPGTGKTTVARLVAGIYQEIGLLSKGALVETDRSGLVAGFVGQTALKTAEVVERAAGGVLFIDEAYSLTSSAGTNDFGSEAVDALVKLMEDHRDDLVVIAAGYTQEMRDFLKANTGLISRFNKLIEFPDYTVEELLQIFCGMAERAGFTIHAQAREGILSYLAGRTEEERRAFGNARGIRNLFEKIVVNQANRIILGGEPTIAQLTLIQEEDVVQERSSIC